MFLARSHIELSHRTYVGDIKTLKRLSEAHDEMHADPRHLMSLPHHH